jgi:NAD(P)-dependent dehydrogenase (short-subunit alcohol dehydrogenase family)
MKTVKALFDLSGRRAIVTGASQGLGEAMALALAEAGADVALVVDKNIVGAEKVADRIKSLGRRSLAIRADVSKSSDVAQMVEKAITEFEHLDLLVNNAGINKHEPAEEMSEQTWNAIIDVDLTGVFLCSKAVSRDMIRRKTGNIINVGSVSGQVTHAHNDQAHYYSAKAGIIMLTKALAAEWAEYNIRVNCISPGLFRTPLIDKFLEDHEDQHQLWIAHTPMRRIGEPHELSGAVVFLASDASSYMTGANLIIDGGYTIC